MRSKGRGRQVPHYSPVAMRVSIHGGEARQGLVGGAAPGISLQEQLLVGAEISHSHLVVKELEKKRCT